ncbi:hypothetical protein EON64_09300 [archaeon]|nr:MAG: hypothetical protein EON64_09300 [archaeon]
MSMRTNKPYAVSLVFTALSAKNTINILLSLDAKGGAGAAAAASSRPSKLKIRPDEAMRILNIEPTELNRKILQEVS